MSYIITGHSNIFLKLAQKMGMVPLSGDKGLDIITKTHVKLTIFVFLVDLLKV